MSLLRQVFPRRKLRHRVNRQTHSQLQVLGRRLAWFLTCARRVRNHPAIFSRHAFSVIDHLEDRTLHDAHDDGASHRLGAQRIVDEIVNHAFANRLRRHQSELHKDHRPDRGRGRRRSNARRPDGGCDADRAGDFEAGQSRRNDRQTQVFEADVIEVHVGQPVSFIILGDQDKRYGGELRAVEPAPENYSNPVAAAAAASGQQFATSAVS